MVSHKSAFLYVGRNCIFWLVVRPPIPKSSLALGVRDPHFSQCVIGLHKYATISFERFKRGARMRQTTDDGTRYGKCVRIGGIASAARAGDSTQ